MPTNIFISPEVRTEQLLYEDLIIESLKMYGQDVYYIPRDIISRDQILNDDRESSFDDAFLVEMYIENTEGFGGEGNLLSKFGLEIRDEATFIVAKRMWEQLVQRFQNNQVRPNEGDLIYIPLSKTFFEISFAEHESPFYQLNNLPVYKLQARLFEYNEEDFSTGIREIDKISTISSYTTSIKLSAFNGDYFEGQSVYQRISTDPEIIVFAKISDYDFSDMILKVYDITSSDGKFHQFIPTDPLLGPVLTSDESTISIDPSTLSSVSEGFNGHIQTVYDNDSVEDKTFFNDENAQNFDFENEADGIIDFSESNPFGEP